MIRSEQAALEVAEPCVRSISWRKKKGIEEMLSTRLQVSIIKSRDDETDRNTGLFVDGYSCNGNFMPDVFRRLGIYKVSHSLKLRLVIINVYENQLNLQ